jgi:hypothetical protein
VAGERVEFDGEHVISTMPLRELILALDPLPPTAVVQAAQQLRYRDYLTVVLIVDRDAVFPDNWIYIHSPEVKMGRIQNYKNWSPEMVPNPSQTSLGLEYFLWDHDPEWDWTTERLVALGIKECAQIGIINPSEVRDGTVVRMRKAYPVYDQQYQNSVTTIREYLAGLSNLQTIGRNGLHRYNNQDHSMLTGIYAARNIARVSEQAGEQYDVWSVNTEQEYLEEGQQDGRIDGSDVSATGDRAIPTRVVLTQADPTPGQSRESEQPGESDQTDTLIAHAFAKLDPLALGVALGSVCGLGLFLATAILLLKSVVSEMDGGGGAVVGPSLSLLRHYLPGFSVTWPGAGIGFLEAASGGFFVGASLAWLWNGGMNAYASLIRRWVNAKAQHDILDKV